MSDQLPDARFCRRAMNPFPLRLFWLTSVPVVIVLAAVGLSTPWMTTTGRVSCVVGASVFLALYLRWLTGKLARRQAVLTRAVEDLVQGNLAERLEAGTDDVAPLALAINRLGAALRDQGHEQLRRAEVSESNRRLLQAVLSTMVEGVVVVDANQRILFTNNAAVPLLDFRTRDVLGKHIWEVARSPRIQELVERLLQAPQPLQEEFELKRTKCIVALNGAPLPAEPIPGAVLVLHDITELRRLEHMRRDFVANVSHELKTPLTSIQAYADTLASGAVDDPERAREFLDRILDQSDRLYRLILDLLQLAKVESESESFAAEDVSVAESVEAALEAHAGIIDSRQINVEVQRPEDPLLARVGRREFRTILENLIGNAVNYTPDGGRVQVVWCEEQGLVRIDVGDTGIGIAREHQARIFERFYRVDRARDRKRGGTGLGLAIVKNLVQVFGGSIELRSELGRGSTFTVRLPLAEPEETPRSPRVTRQTP